MRVCKCCQKGIVGHPNKKFCNSKCKDRYHNLKPNRIWRSREFENHKSQRSNIILAMINMKQDGLRIHIDTDVEDSGCNDQNCIGCLHCLDFDEDDF